ncbi:LysR family transcriptional regulator [Rhodoferax aquaticus]|uniref:LysR family transcriptional regulator n=1 Tax=Rhodoferax aquaticus TaxID=2527691 RepID=A0A515EVP4_9BURK|nr:LysR family transcriptional regulator [Rhodoferax aquaticus]
MPTFRAVAQLSSLRAAGEQLHLTHSAISQQIRLLEEQIGFPVFDRRGRRVVLNEAGIALLRVVEQALSQLDEGVRMAGAIAHGEAQLLRLTVLPSFAQHWLLPRMHMWRQEHPTLTMEIHTSLKAMDLKRDGYHAALRQGRGPWRGLTATKLLDSPLLVVCAPSFATRLKGCNALDLLHEPLLGTRARWEAWFAKAGHDCRVTPTTVFNDMGIMLQAAERGLGIGLGREMLVRDALHEGRLVQLFPEVLLDANSDTFWLVYPPELADWAPLCALQNWLIRELNEAGAANKPDGVWGDA